MLRLTLFGGLQIELDGAPVRELASRKAAALLVYLAVTGREQRRESLTGLLWSDHPHARAAGNLRVVLSSLRQQIPGALHVTRQTAALDPHYPLWVDALELERTVSDKTIDPARLERAVALYRGPFLEGFHLRGAPVFEEWALVEQERFLRLASQGLRRLAQERAAQGEYDAAIVFARRLLALDPWREEAHRELMRFLALSGQRSAALSQYEVCCQLLAAELGLEPLDETTALYEQIRDEPVALSPAMTEKTAWGPAGPPFVGRREEHTRLVQWWQAARRGRGRLALVAGEAGVGKTRLIEEVLRYGAARGAAALRGNCYEFGCGLPYQAIAHALRQAIELAPLSIDPQPASCAWLSELVLLLPELRDLGLPPPLPSNDETARQRLFEAVARFLARQHGTCILFLDDLHWADPATLDLLHYLVRRLAGQPLWIVGAYRCEEVDLGHPLERLRRGLGRDRLAEHLALAPLAPTAVHELAVALGGGESGPALGDLLYHESQGNPLFLIETVDSLWEEELLYGEPGALHWAGPPAAIPRGIQDVVLQRVGRLTPPARRLLAMAAAIGRPFDLPLLRVASGGDDHAAAGLDECLRRHMIHSPPTAHPQFDFSHAKIRAVVYGATDAAQRREHHRQVGQAIEQLYGEQSPAPYGELAYHYEQAGLVERALHYLLVAAAQARAIYAHQEALGCYERALALAAGRPERWSLELERVRTLRSLARYDEAAAAGEAVWRAWEAGQVESSLAARTARELSALDVTRREYGAARAWALAAQRLSATGSGEGARREQARCWQALAAVEQEQGRLERAQQLFQQALAIHEQLADPAGRATCLKGLGHVLSGWGRYDESRERLEQALPIFRRLDDRQSEATCLCMIGMAWWRQRQYEPARQTFAQSLAMCQAIGDRAGEAAALNGLGLVAITQDDLAETRRCWEESVALYRALGLEKRAAAGLHNLGILYIGAADYRSARRCLEESLALDRPTGDRASEALGLGWLGRLHLLSGDYDAARRCLDEALALGQEVGGGEEESHHLAWRGAVAYEMGAWAEARTYLERAVGLARENGTGLGVFENCVLAQVHLAQGDGPAALALIRPLLPADKDQNTGSLHAMLGVIHCSGLLAESDDPVPHFERALVLLRHKDTLAYGIALRRYGACLLRRGDQAEGERRLGEALQVLERLGARGEAHKVSCLLAGDVSPALGW